MEKSGTFFEESRVFRVWSEWSAAGGKAVDGVEEWSGVSDDVDIEDDYVDEENDDSEDVLDEDEDDDVDDGKMVIRYGYGYILQQHSIPF